MKILYAIQGTGNGHLSRARDIIPILKQKCDLDILVSGIQADVSLPYEVKYKLKGLSFIFGKKGGVDIWKTYKKNHVYSLNTEVRDLPIDQYDLVINDFEPISAWAAKLNDVPCVSLSHQCSLQSPLVPKPSHTDWIGHFILKYYAPTQENYGFHFKPYDKNIFTPVIRQEIRSAENLDLGHYTVYLPAYDDEKIIKVLSKIEGAYWQVFSKHTKKMYLEGSIFIQPIQNEAFIKSLTTCTGLLCGAGFESPAEALYLNKKLMVIPMKSQYEQHYNAAALLDMGVPVIKSLKKKHLNTIQQWIDTDMRIPVHYPDETERIIDSILNKYNRILLNKKK